MGRRTRRLPALPARMRGRPLASTSLGGRMQRTLPFSSFFLGGFECSTHRRANGAQLDLLSATRHDMLAQRDYAQLKTLGIATVRDGMRWHLIETRPGHYDWRSLLPMVQAAHTAGVQVIWDLCHYGWPLDLDIWSPQFVVRFARFAREAARLIASESGSIPWFCPVNEISFWAWAGGELGHMAPVGLGRGAELKRQLVRASLAARAEIRAAVPHARFIDAEPLIHVVPATFDPADIAAAEGHRLSQYEAFDMLSGRRSRSSVGRRRRSMFSGSISIRTINGCTGAARSR